MSHPFNSTTALLKLKQRNGLKVTTYSSATSQYIESVRIRKKAQLLWESNKESFEGSYSKCKGYDYHYVNKLSLSLQGLMFVKLQKLGDDMNEHGWVGLENFLLNRMKIDRENPVLRNTRETNYHKC